MESGLTKHIVDLGFGDTTLKLKIPPRFQILTEVEVWCPTNIEGDRAEAVAQQAHDWLKQEGLDPDDSPVMVSPEGVLCVRGRADVLILDVELKQFWVIDFKTKASYGFRKLKEEGNGYDYVIQVLAYVRGYMHDEPDWTCQGAFLYYEDHDKRNHMVLPVDLEETTLDMAVDTVSKVLRNWVTGGPISEAPAVYAAPGKWNKARHAGAAGCLPWQCNYCTVGPEVAKCIDEESFKLQNIQGPNDDVPKWEVSKK
jgi:hypothetical protein